LAMNAEELQALKKPVALLAEIGDHYTNKKVLVLRHGPHPLQVYLQVVGGWSKTSFKSVLPPTDGDGDGDEEEEEAANDIRDEMKFPGCLPNITSNTTTPKL